MCVCVGGGGGSLNVASRLQEMHFFLQFYVPYVDIKKCMLMSPFRI